MEFQNKALGHEQRSSNPGITDRNNVMNAAASMLGCKRSQVGRATDMESTVRALPKTLLHDVADWSESVKASSFATTLRGGRHASARERFLLGVACCWMLLLGTPSSASAALPGEPATCILNIKGHSIASLTLIRQGDVAAGAQEGLSGQKHVRPGKSLHLPAGKYRVENVELEGGYRLKARHGRNDDWLELAPDKPCELIVGAPLSPQVTVKRHGRYLQMDYDLVDAAQRSYTKVANDGAKLTRPRFTVSKGNEVLGSESFEYG
jgi:hypothetical protein